MEDVKLFATYIFKIIPLSTIICVILLDSKFVSLLGDLTFSNSSPAWMFLTRFGSKGKPVVLLLAHAGFAWWFLVGRLGGPKIRENWMVGTIENLEIHQGIPN